MPKKSDADVLKQIEDHRTAGADFLATWYEDARECFRFVAGKQWDESQLEAFRKENRPPVTFNFCGQYIDSVRGQEQANRQETRYLPRTMTDGDPQYADMMTNAAKWARDLSTAEHKESHAFSDMMTCGLGWICTEMDYGQDPDGRILNSRRSPFHMRYDPAATDHGLADAMWFQCDYWRSPEEIKLRWPKSADMISEALEADSEGARKSPSSDTREEFYDGPASAGDRMQGKIRLIHEVYCCLESRRKFAEDDELKDVTEDAWLKGVERMEALGKELPNSTQYLKRVWYQAWYCDGELLEHGKAPTQVGSVYTPITGKLEELTGHWYGIIRPLIDPQRYANTMIGQVWQMMRGGAKGGLIAEAGAFANQAKAEAEWAKPNGITFVNPGFIDKIQPKPAPDIPPSAGELLTFVINSFRGVTGVNTEMVGQSDKDQPGIVEQLRTKASLIILAPWFDSLTLYRKMQGLVMADFINQFIPDGRLIRILGSDGMQSIPFRKTYDAMEYDIVVDESATSRDVKERTFVALMEMIPLAQQMGAPIPPEVLDYAPLPDSLKATWRQMIEEVRNQPKQPPIALQIEQAKAESAMQQQRAKQEFEVFKQQLELQTQQQIESAQAQSQQAIEAAKLQNQQQQELLKLEVAKAQAQMDAIMMVFKIKLETEADLQKEAMRADVAMAQAELNAAMPQQLGA